MHLDHEAMVLGHAPVKRIDEVGARRFKTAPCHIGEALGIGLPRGNPMPEEVLARRTTLQLKRSC